MTANTTPSFNLDDVRIPSLAELEKILKSPTIDYEGTNELKLEVEGKSGRGKKIQVRYWATEGPYQLQLAVRELPDGDWESIGGIYPKI